MDIRIMAVATLTAISTSTQAQNRPEGTPYFLPKTAVRITLQIEKTTYTPGDFADYAPRFLKTSPQTDAQVTYRIVGKRVSLCSEPDSTRMFYLKAGEKQGISNISLDDKGILLAVNDQPTPAKTTDKRFVPAPRKPRQNPRDFLSQEILAAGSVLKMAELTAQDIYDIRDSRNQLARGQADFMPKDGEQLKLMLQKLDIQEQALLQLFNGIIEKDTSEVEVSYVPEKEVTRQVLFRFSKKLGLTDADDLGGNPYYISVKDEHSLPAPIEEGSKKKKEPVVYACTPGKITLDISEGTRPWLSYTMYAAQFGRLNPLDEDLLNKKVNTFVVLNPYNGAIEKIKTEQAR